MFGFKPSFGRVSRRGVMPAVTTLDCVGPFARDMDALIACMAAIDPHFGALPDLALNSDLLTIVPQMYAANLLPRHDLRVWDLPAAAAPAYEVRLVWHASTAQDPAQQWIRSQVHALFGRGD